MKRLLKISLYAAAIILAGACGVYHYVSTHNNSALYLTAVANANESHRLTVNVRVDNKLRLSSVPGDNIPIITLTPGRHVVRVDSRGYISHTEIVKAGPHGDYEIYVYASLDRK